MSDTNNDLSKIDANRIVTDIAIKDGRIMDAVNWPSAGSNWCSRLLPTGNRCWKPSVVTKYTARLPQLPPKYVVHLHPSVVKKSGG